jgi:hypothetical protein
MDLDAHHAVSRLAPPVGYTSPARPVETPIVGRSGRARLAEPAERKGGPGAFVLPNMRARGLGRLPNLNKTLAT